MSVIPKPHLEPNFLQLFVIVRMAAIVFQITRGAVSKGHGLEGCQGSLAYLSLALQVVDQQSSDAEANAGIFSYMGIGSSGSW